MPRDGQRSGSSALANGRERAFDFRRVSGHWDRLSSRTLRIRNTYADIQPDWLRDDFRCFDRGNYSMSLSLRHCTVAIILLVSVVLAAVPHTGRGSEGIMSSMIEATSPNARAMAELALSDEERGLVYAGIMRMPNAVVAHAPAPEAVEALPDDVAMQDLPRTLTQHVPLVRGHKFVKFDDRIVVVEPASRVVVALIPRYRLLP
jgi:hypothetical protein